MKVTWSKSWKKNNSVDELNVGLVSKRNDLTIETTEMDSFTQQQLNNRLLTAKAYVLWRNNMFILAYCNHENNSNLVSNKNAHI